MDLACVGAFGLLPSYFRPRLLFLSMAPPIALDCNLRQGDPLSLLLFVLAADVLSSMFNHILDSHILHGVPLERFGNLCHLQYVDDLIILLAGESKDLRNIKLILFLFEGISRLAINFSKTCLFPRELRVSPSLVDLATLNCSTNVLPISYLGIPIAGRRSRRQDWEFLIQKIKDRLTSWKVNLVSLGGRLTLINSILSALPTY